MYVIKLLGGLGNQLFQYAAALAIAEANRTVVKLDVSWFKRDLEYQPHNRYQLHCFNIPAPFASMQEVSSLTGVQITRTERWLRKGLSLCRLRQLYRLLECDTPRIYSQPSFAFDSGFLDIPDNYYLMGMFQSEKFFQSVENLLKLQLSLRYPPTTAVSELQKAISSGPSAAIHFRRGDYVSDKGFASTMGIIDLAYYQRAVELLLERVPNLKLYIFSDDIDSVASEFHLTCPHHFVRCVDSWHPWDKIRLMQSCDHIAIANSTFSWWAAWLNPNPHKIVIAPKPWFSSGEHEESDLVPLRWIRLSRSGVQ